MGVAEAIIFSSILTTGVGLMTQPKMPKPPEMPKAIQPSQSPVAKRAINPDMAALFKKGAGIATTPSGLTSQPATTKKTALGA